ncbi:ribonuclease III [Candidatus Gottesmanbacteria bacterium]|nr:ribonuclease III [Candidatus Gottesmanbacteria bacterium]MBI5465655.1 ribonuclease III [Candidatus Gottesmanbacteria bacterium]
MNLSNLEENLGLKFKDRRLLEQALTHRSYLNENKDKKLVSNERLEFLGDAVLSLIVSNFLYQKFSSSAEGDLTNFRASLVKTPTLAKIAQKIELGKCLFLSRGEEEGGGRENPGILADSLEALIGAIFLDNGLAKTTGFVTTHLLPVLSEVIESKTLKDFKSLLQEKTQAKDKTSPTYKVLKVVGPDHNRIFTIGVFLNAKKLGVGTGRSKQEAEQEAAKAALEKL